MAMGCADQFQGLPKSLSKDPVMNHGTRKIRDLAIQHLLSEKDSMPRMSSLFQEDLRRSVKD